MTDTNAQELALLGKLIIGVAAMLIVVGILWHGVALENFQRMWSGLTERPSGPMAFRFILQPSMAAVAAPTAKAVRDGLHDARTEPFVVSLDGPFGTIAGLRAGVTREQMQSPDIAMATLLVAIGLFASSLCCCVKRSCHGFETAS